MLYKNITEVIGNTPLLELDAHVHGLKNIRLYAKLEYLNPFGSVKDRIAWGMVKDDIGAIQSEHKTLLEMSSGNTAKALVGIAGIFGVPFKTITNRIKVSEVKDILKILGAEIDELPGNSDCHDPSDPNDPLVFIQKEIAKRKEGVYFTSQYDNPKNIEAHEATTGKEILNDLARVDYLIGGIGTSGSTRGTAQTIRTAHPSLKTVGVIAATRDYIPGIRNKDEVLEVGLFDPDFYDHLEEVDSKKAVDGMLELNRKYGVFAGPTSGAAYAATLRYLESIDEQAPTGSTAVFIACDRMEWYVSYIKARRPELFGVKNGQSDEGVSDSELSAVPSLSPEEARIAFREHAVCIDTRTPLAFQVGHIPGSLNFPEASFAQLVASGHPFAKDQRVIIACPTGEKSRWFAASLKKRGWKNVSSLASGVMGWRNANLPLER
jgi:cysteine synthase B